MVDPIVDMVVLVSQTHQQQLDAVAKALTQSGCSDLSILRSTGVITGKVRRGHLEELKRLPGVAAVEESRESRATS